MFKSKSGNLPPGSMTAEEYAEKRTAILQDLSSLDEQEKEYKETHRIEFFKPFYYQEKILKALHAGKKNLTLQGANQIGKTVLGAVVSGSASLGVQPWDGMETVWGRRPVRGRILCSDWEHHAREVIVPELKHWFPLGTYETQKNNVGVEAFWRFPETGSTIELLTHIQPTQIHEGWKGDWVWADEPLPRDKYISNQRGLIARNGIFLLTMTAVSESWILDEIVMNADKSFYSVTQIKMRENPTLSEEAISKFSSALKTDELLARVEGGWLNLAGLVWKMFDKDVHIIDDFTIPTDWPVVPMIDFHPTIPVAISFYSYDPQDRMYAIDDVFKHISPEETADEIIRRKTREEIGRAHV